MSTVDPVQVLREYIAKSKEIKLKEDNLIFGSKAFNLLTPTNWKPKNTEKPYKLGEIWLFLDAKVTKSGQLKDYFEALKNMGQKYKLKLISAPHQDEIIKYFTGQIETSECINTSERLHIKPEEYLNKRSKPSGPMSEEKFASLKVLKTEAREKMPEIIREIDFEANLEENRKNLEGLRMKERLLESKNSRLRKGRSFKHCVELLEKGTAAPNTKDEKSNRTILEEILSLSQLEGAKPIIIVPNGQQNGNLCLKNAKSFLVDGKYIQPSEAKSLETNVVEFKYEINDQEVAFEICDDMAFINAQKKRDRVVAIFLNDNPYQFKTAERLYGESNIAKLMTKMRGYYMKYSDVKINDIIKTWNIRQLSINRTQRHRDILIKREFWEDLSCFLNTRR